MDDFHCSFCGKRRREVFKLISGPRVFICDECTELCVRVIEKENAAEASGTSSDEKDGASAKKKQMPDCTFCGKSADDVKFMIAGPAVYICDACVGISVQIIEEERAAQKPSS